MPPLMKKDLDQSSQNFYRQAMSHRVTKYRKVAIVGNSDSGKSTLAKMLATEDGIETLDLDTIAWESNQMAILRDMDAQLTDGAQLL